jgi:hypothetical protein
MVLILDRYIYDFLMSWEWLGYSNDFIKWLCFRFPKPDMAFICDASAQTCYERKKITHNYDLEFYKIQRKRYLNLANELGPKVINTEKKIKQTLGEVQKEFRKFFINKLSDEDKVLTLVSYPYFTPRLINDLGLKINWNSLDWNYIIDMATKNNVEFLLCKNLLNYYEKILPKKFKKKIRKVLNICEEQKGKVFKTLEIISERFKEENIEFIVFKTFPSFDYIPTDIDILVKENDFEKAKKILKGVFSTEISHIGHKAKTFKKREFIPVDLHYEISWMGTKVINERGIWDHCRKVKINRMEFYLPSLQDELSIIIKHSVFQHHYTTLGEFYWIISLLRKANRSDLISDDYIKFLIDYCILKEFLIYGQKDIELTNFLKNNNLKKILNTINIVFFHPVTFIPKNTVRQTLDFCLTFYRNIRFWFNKKLAYNENWIQKRKKICGDKK